MGQFFVDALKQAIIKLTHKSGKNLNLPTLYRPISLLSCILKALENSIKLRLEYFLGKNVFCHHPCTVLGDL